MTTHPEQHPPAPEVVGLPEPSVRIPKHNPMRRGMVVKPPPLALWDEAKMRAYAEAQVREEKAAIVAYAAGFGVGADSQAVADLVDAIERDEHRA